ncbi:serine/threonine protein kinase, AGC [Ascosphaera pollenicola]|nr:serine/threonine protein kinase, AGC [Ascosphaera pollenicola]
MGRRHFEKPSGRSKRRKIADESYYAENGRQQQQQQQQQQQAITLTSHRQLRDLLYPQQGAQEVKQGVRAFKDFLTSINDTRDENAAQRANGLKILKAYCDSQFSKPADEHEPAVCFADIIQTWSYGESTNDESLMSLVPSILASFLKTTSSLPDFKEFALALCKHLLQKDQLRLINRAFQSPKAKDHLISPCIRLLTEVVSFDGGVVAKLVFARRDITLKRLDTFLITGKNAAISADGSDRKKLTLRRIAQRYVLAHLKFQTAQMKEEFLSQGKIMRSFLEEIRRDARDMVIEIIYTLDWNVVSDSTLSRIAKSRLMNRWNLERLVTLYGYEKDSDEPLIEGEASVLDEIHKFLISLCTNSDKGVLLLETGWYPTGSTPDVLPLKDKDSIPLGLNSPLYIDRYRDAVPVRNGNLSALIQVLRPESDTLQMDLLLKILRAAPELVYDYFSKRTMFTSDPKPTPAWLGESTFLFSTIQLPALKDCGWKDSTQRPVVVPPPAFVVIESIIPRPLTQKILTRCLNQNTDVVTIFAVRIITLALKKMQAVLRIFNQKRDYADTALWEQASSQLLELFVQRCPNLKDIIALFRSTPRSNLSQQNATLELISVYYEVLPTIALEEKFDVTLTLISVLEELNKPDINEDDKEMLFSELENLLSIAQQATTLRWWQKPGSLEYSAFTSILKVLLEASNDSQTPVDDLKALVRDVLLSHSVLMNSKAFDALLKSIDTGDSGKLATQLIFLDNCITRLAKKPVFYLDMTEELKEDRQDGKPNLSLLVPTISEQWPFVVKAGDADKEAVIASWIARFLAALYVSGEHHGALKKARNTVQQATTNKQCQSVLKKAFKHLDESAVDEDGDTEKTTIGGSSTIKPSSDQPQLTVNVAEAELTNMFGSLPGEPTSHSALTKWDRSDVEEALEQGYISSLTLCLCSAHSEIRLQASSALQKFMHKLMESAHPDKSAVYIVLGEVLETAKTVDNGEALPYIGGELGVALLNIVLDPLHKLFAKANKFLNKGPRWEVAKIPSYFVDKILLNESEYDDGWADEVAWLLAFFVTGLRTPRDLDIYRRANVFERVLSLYNSPSLTNVLRKEILRLLFRAMQIKGGATTLVTRAGVISWIAAQVSAGDTNREVLKRLAVVLEGRSDREWTKKWSGGHVSKVVAHTVG